MGPSGSGKSTLMHILAGLDRPTSATVSIAGIAIGDLNDTQLTKLRRTHIGFIFQFFNLLPMLTAKENIVLPLSIAGAKPDHGWVEELAAKVGLADRLSHRPAEIPADSSSAWRSPVRSSRADRDVRRRADRQPRLEDERRDPRAPARIRLELGQTTVMVTHDARAAAIADRVLFLADGEIVTGSRPVDVRTRSSDARGGERR